MSTDLGPQEQDSKTSGNGLQQLKGLDRLELGLAMVHIDAENVGIVFHDVGGSERLEHRIQTSPGPHIFSVDFLSKQQ